PDRVAVALQDQEVEPAAWVEVADNDLESAARLFADLPKGATAVVGVGGGKALDVAKYVGFLGRLPYYAVPTSLSNDGFCSPQSSLTVRGKRRSLPAALPFGVVMEVCGSSRPASGGEHLISHALDAISARPRLHGLQVGVASYLVGVLQGENAGRIAGLFAATGFWEAVAADPFSRAEWLAAV